nr:EOG090X09NT [Lepidurus arcticus]
MGESKDFFADTADRSYHEDLNSAENEFPTRFGNFEVFMPDPQQIFAVFEQQMDEMINSFQSLLLSPFLVFKLHCAKSHPKSIRNPSIIGNCFDSQIQTRFCSSSAIPTQLKPLRSTSKLTTSNSLAEKEDDAKDVETTSAQDNDILKPCIIEPIVKGPVWSMQSVDWQKLPSYYSSLSKYRLTMLVVCSAVSGYAMAPAPFDPVTLVLCLTGTALTSGAANTVNQFLEVPFDSQMTRTSQRVLVRGLVTPLHAVTYGIVSGITGLGMLYYGVNGLCASFGALTLLLYTSVYTPMKRTSIANTWVGSLVGAIPPIMGYVGCTGSIDAGALLLAGVLFAWQFPHFNALSWNLRPDYSRAGYRMMAVTDPGLCRRTTLRYSVAMIGLCTLAPYVGLTTWAFALDSLPVNIYLTLLGWRFYKHSDSKNSRKLFRASLLQLPIVLLLMLLHKKDWKEEGDRDVVLEWAYKLKQQLLKPSQCRMWACFGVSPRTTETLTLTMVVMRSCCCCCTTKTGSTVIGVLYLLSTIGIVISLAYTLNNTEETRAMFNAVASITMNSTTTAGVNEAQGFVDKSVKAVKDAKIAGLVVTSIYCILCIAMIIGVCQRLDFLGLKVYACCLDSNGVGAKELQASCSDKMQVVQMNVTDDEAIERTVKYVSETLGDYKLWALVNNAGIGSVVEFEWAPLATFQRTFDVNTLGPVRVTKAFLPLLREAGEARVAITASISGRITFPGCTAYAMSKHAVTALADGLRREMKKWNISVHTIEPTLYK